MNKKNFALIAVVLVLATVYVIYFTGWFRTKPIIISHTNRPMGYRGRGVLLFSLGGEYTLKEIKVVPLDEWQTNKLAQPLWHLVGETSDPINHFFYGRNLEGMTNEVEGTRATPLQPGTQYRLFISASTAKGWHDFQTSPAPPAPAVRPNP